MTISLDGEVSVEQISSSFGPQVSGGPAGSRYSAGEPVAVLPLGDRQIAVTTGRWIVPFAPGYPMPGIVDVTGEWRMLNDGTSPLRSRDTIAAGWSTYAASNDDVLAVAVSAPVYEGFAAVHSSTDGLTWSSTELTAPLSGQAPTIVSLADGEPGFVALAAEETMDDFFGAAVWFSPDGRDWQYRPLPPVGSATPVAVYGVDGGFVALGRWDRAAGQLAVWRSEDGVEWEVLPAIMDGLDRPARFVMHEGSIVLVTQSELLVSGSWGYKPASKAALG